MSQKGQIRPSTLFLSFFRWFCDPRMVDDIEGDLLERFEIRLRKKGTVKARWLFIKDVIQLFRPGIIKNFQRTQKLNNFDMFKNYLKTARRNLVKQKTYSAIKTGGFAIGISVCLLITLFILDEMSFDRHIQDHEHLYMVVKEYHENGEVEKYTWFPPPFSEAIEADFPEVIQSGRMLFGEGFGAGTANIRRQGEVTNYFDDGFAFADQAIMELFNFPMVYGNLKTALSEPQSIVLTQSKAEMLFPGINPVGEVLYVDDNTKQPYKVSGVIEDLPENSTVRFNYLWSLKDREFWSGEQGSWGANNYQTFIRLRPDADLTDLQPRLKAIGTKYILPTYLKAGYSNALEIVESIHFSLLPMADLHLHSADVADPFEKSDIRYILVFGLIAFFILGLACINFINLSTAKSANRAKEVGLRKTIGSTKRLLIGQFLTESIFYSFLSFVLAIGISTLLLPYFNQLAEKSIALPWTSYWFIPSLLMAALLIGALAGIYPAFYLSAFRPAAVLKGRLSTGSKSSRLRNALVVIQFATSIVLVTGTLVVYNQMQYILNKEIGYDKEQVLLIQSPYLLNDNLQSFHNELTKMPDVKSATYSGFLPVTGSSRNGNMYWQNGRTRIDNGIGGQNWMVDHDYIETLGIRLVEGRNFSRELSTDSAAMIINQTMAHRLGISEAPLGKRITNDTDNRLIYTVIGVVEDFNYESLTKELEPLAMRLGKNYSTMAIKMNTEDLTTTIDQINDQWKAMAPGQPINYEFLDQRFDSMYANVVRTQNILTSFAILAIVIACLGLFGLSVFMVEQRNKEISVRLLLGAKTSQVIRLLGFNFLKPIALAVLIAVPVAWYVMKDWLQGFEYNTGLDIGLFAIASLITLLIALFTISFQSVKAALSNPVNGLRSE